MRHRSFLKVLMLGLAIGIAVSGRPAAVRAGTVSVAQGYDLIHTQDGTNIKGLDDLMVVPLGTYNFGGAIGNQKVPGIDVIVQRLQDATVTAPGAISYPVTAKTINLAVVALQLETVKMTNFNGNGLDNYFVTLSPKAASTGTMDITFASAAGGTFTSTLDLNLDVHKGSLNGKVVDSFTNVVIKGGPTNWGRTAPPGAVTIKGVNLMLDGKDTDQDFWLTAKSTPEPSTWFMLLTAGLIVPVYAQWTRRPSFTR